jgi:uncharacterized protein YndB with AHSA1/START domain
LKGKGENKKSGGIGDTAVRARTRKGWAEWFKILDAAGARRMSHREIVAVLSQEYPKLGSWWQQMVTVSYEQARGLREKHQRPGGYEISVSRTLGASAWALYGAWKDAEARSRWLSEKPIVIRKATANKRLRITWVDGRSSLEVSFNPRGSGKSQIVVQHGKLPDADAAARMKGYWARALERLKESLEL